MKEDWIEINSQKDLPKDRNKYCWFVNRTNKSIFLSKTKELLGQSLLHETFSHYMLIDLKEPKPPKNICPLPEKSKTVFEENNIFELIKIKKTNKMSSNTPTEVVA